MKPWVQSPAQSGGAGIAAIESAARQRQGERSEVKGHLWQHSEFKVNLRYTPKRKNIYISKTSNIVMMPIAQRHGSAIAHIGLHLIPTFVIFYNP